MNKAHYFYFLRNISLKVVDSLRIYNPSSNIFHIISRLIIIVRKLNDHTHTPDMNGLNQYL